MGIIEAFFGIVITLVLFPFILAIIGAVLYLVFVVWLFFVHPLLGVVVLGGTVWFIVWWANHDHGRDELGGNETFVGEK